MDICKENWRPSWIFCSWRVLYYFSKGDRPGKCVCIIICKIMPVICSTIWDGTMFVSISQCLAITVLHHQNSINHKNHGYLFHLNSEGWRVISLSASCVFQYCHVAVSLSEEQYLRSPSCGLLSGITHDPNNTAHSLSIPLRY